MPKKKHPWYKSRGYLHFDLPVSLRKAQSIVMSAKKVALHSFYPFVDYAIKTEKIKKDSKTGKLSSIPKSRPIASASHVDSHIYSYYGWLLSQRYEEKLEELGIGESVLAFRSLGKSNIEFADQVFRDIESRQECGVVALDITGFFDNLNHRVLKETWANIIGESHLPNDHYAVYRSLTKFSRVDRNDVYDLLSISEHNPKSTRRRICSPEEFRSKVRKSGLIRVNLDSKGIPQGSPISALLSNIYMLNFDSVVSTAVEEMGGKYYRYCDDMIIVVPLEHRDGVAGFVSREIRKLKLDINNKKTEIREFKTIDGELMADRPLQYLGFLFDGQRKLLRSASLARYSDRMKRGVNLAKRTRKKYNRLKVMRGEKTTKLHRKELYSRYSHLGSRNFIRYGYRAADIMDSKAMRKQLKPLWGRLQEEIER